MESVLADIRELVEYPLCHPEVLSLAALFTWRVLHSRSMLDWLCMH
jgi:hypothetical protein